MLKIEMPDNILHILQTLFHDGGYGTSVSVFSAVLIFLIQSRQRRKAERRNQTLSVLLSLESIERLAVADRKFAKWIKTGHKFDGETIGTEEESTVIDLLDFYEMVCTSIFMGNLDYKVTSHLRGGPMEGAYRVCENYIGQTRARLSRPEV